MPAPIKYVIPNNIPVQLNDESSGDLIGFGIAERDGADNKQLQHWIMFTRDLSGSSFPERPVWISKATTPDWKDVTSIADFKTLAARVFLEYRDLYVIANCTAHQGETFPVIPAEPSFPALGSRGYQGYWGIAPIQTRRNVVPPSSELSAYLFVRVPDDGHAVEYWALGERYQPPDGSHSTLVMSFPDIEGADFVRLIDGTFWTADSTLVIAACTYYARMP